MRKSGIYPTENVDVDVAAAASWSTPLVGWVSVTEICAVLVERRWRQPRAGRNPDDIAARAERLRVPFVRLFRGDPTVRVEHLDRLFKGDELAAIAGDMERLESGIIPLQMAGPLIGLPELFGRDLVDLLARRGIPLEGRGQVSRSGVLWLALILERERSRRPWDDLPGDVAPALLRQHTTATTGPGDEDLPPDEICKEICNRWGIAWRYRDGEGWDLGNKFLQVNAYDMWRMIGHPAPPPDRLEAYRAAAEKAYAEAIGVGRPPAPADEAETELAAAVA